MSSDGILTTYWPLLKMLQILGACPIRKDKTIFSGFKPFSSTIYFAIVMSVWLTVTIIMVSLVSYLVFLQGIMDNLAFPNLTLI